MSNNQEYVNWFRQSSPYINAHRGKTFVLMVDGEAIAHPNFANIIHDIALLNSLGVRLVICHGARPQIEARLEQQELRSQFHKGLRITDMQALWAITQAVGSVRAQIEALLSMGLPNSPMHGAKIRVVGGNLVTAKPIGVIDGVDHQHTGTVRRIDHESINHFLDTKDIVLLSNLGYSTTGEIFNLALDDLAVATAAALRADKLIVLDQQSGILDHSAQLVRELDLFAAEQLLRAETQGSGNKNTHQLSHDSTSLHNGLSTLVKACRNGVNRGHLISYAEDGALLEELFTRDGAGTLVSKSNYEQVRQAHIDDVGGILELLSPLEANGTLVKRSRELLENEVERFAVIDRDGMIIACAALYPYTDNRTAELAGVVTHPDYRGGQRAARVLLHLENTARQQGVDTVFILTTQTAHWFIEQGFKESSVEQLPEEKLKLYNFQRNSKVFVKSLIE
jgi:amino-acid N-acetyltransferase